MLRVVKPENLGTYLRQISGLFPEFDSDREVSTADIIAYYRESFWGYAVFHSWAGAIHMALSPDGKFSKNDYFRQAEEVRNRAGDLENINVICELGCGRGFNVSFLARQLPAVDVIGIDISDRNLSAARKSFGDIPNLSFIDGDFHSISSLLSGPVDLFFAVESICHATDIGAVLTSVASMLNPEGRLHVYDGFRQESPIEDSKLRRAVQLTERAMVIPRFLRESEFAALAQSAGLRITRVRDRSQEIMPNLLRLSDFAKSFFKIRPAGRIIKSIFPDGLVKNAIAGLLMAVTIQEGAHRYIQIEMEKS